MLLDPFKEKFNLPALPVEFGDSERVKLSVVGDEPVNDTGSIVFICYHSDRFGVMFFRFITCKSDQFITDNTRLVINTIGAFNNILHVVFCPGDKKCSLLVDEIEHPKEIQVAKVNHINSCRLYIKLIEDLDIVHGSLGQVDKNRKIAPEVQQCMHLDTALVFPEGSPWAELQTQAYSAAVKSIDKIVNIKPEVIIPLIHRACNINKHPGKICIYAPITEFIGFCKGVSWDSMLNAAVIEFARDCIKAVFYIPKTVSLGKLGKTHNIEMIPAGKLADSMVPVIAVNTFIEFVFGYHGHKLSKDGLPLIHGDNRYDLALNVNFKSFKNLIFVMYLLLTYYILIAQS